MTAVSLYTHPVWPSGSEYGGKCVYVVKAALTQERLAPPVLKVVGSSPLLVPQALNGALEIRQNSVKSLHTTLHTEAHHSHLWTCLWTAKMKICSHLIKKNSVYNGRWHTCCTLFPGLSPRVYVAHHLKPSYLRRKSTPYQPYPHIPNVSEIDLHAPNPMVLSMMTQRKSQSLHLPGEPTQPHIHTHRRVCAQ